MKKLRNQILESFFNPLLHFFPLLIFIFTRDIVGNYVAWEIAIVANIILLIYVFIRYRRILDWFLSSTGIFLIISTIILVIPERLFNISFEFFAGEIVVLLFFISSLLLRKKLEKLMVKATPKNFSMINNLDELFRLMWIFTIVIFAYIIVELSAVLVNPPNIILLQEFIHGIFLVSVVFIIIYELIRVTVIRIRLIREEWWPIVNEQGKFIGSIHYLTSLKEDKKYMHPIVRVILIDKNKIFLQKRSENDLVYPGLWDTAISNHIRLNEKIDHCIVRTANERYGIKEIKPIFLSHYVHETPEEFHYAYIFVSCKYANLTPNPKYIDQTKWWTIQQIEENVNSGIFSENFLIELNFLKRSGIIDSGSCECECNLKETVNRYNLHSR